MYRLDDLIDERKSDLRLHIYFQMQSDGNTIQLLHISRGYTAVHEISKYKCSHYFISVQSKLPMK